MVDRNGVATSRSATPDREAAVTLGPGSGHNSILKKSGSLDLSDKRQRLKKEASMDHEDPKLKPEVPDYFGSTTIKQVETSFTVYFHYHFLVLCIVMDQITVLIRRRNFVKHGRAEKVPTHQCIHIFS